MTKKLSFEFSSPKKNASINICIFEPKSTLQCFDAKIEIVQKEIIVACNTAK